jgi:hypothetical protein
MYEKLMLANQANKIDIIYLLGLHCTKSRKFKKIFIADIISKKTNIL